MSDYLVKQIQPNHADHISYYNEKFLRDMLEHETVIAQPKYDGERMLIHFDDGKVYCTSRRYSKKTGHFMENQDKLPVLSDVAKRLKLGYTVIDCEAYAKDWSTVVGILHSLPERAIELQKSDIVKFAAFDCLFYDGEDIREKSYLYRLSCLIKVIKTIDYEPLHLVKFMRYERGMSYDWSISDLNLYGSLICIEDINNCMNTAIDRGFEGVVIKSLDKKYYDKAASLKCKKFETVDCVVYDYQPGRGKYEGTIGALLIGYYDKDTDKIIHLSKVNCSTDEERNRWRDEWSTRKMSVIEVKCQEITDKSLRHPVYIRLRDDKDYTMCTRETIFKEQTMTSDYDVYHDFDINKHKAMFVCYFEVVISPDGKVEYAVPSHQVKAQQLACKVKKCSIDDLNRRCPFEYYGEYLQWLLSISGYIAVWNDFYIRGLDTELTSSQRQMLETLKREGIYHGSIEE